MVKYIVEDGFSKIKKTGIGQYTIMIEKVLSNLNLERIEIKKTHLEKIKNKILRRMLYILWLNTFFLLKLLFIREKVVVFFTNFAIPVIKLSHVKYIPIIHDLAPIKYPDCTSKLINTYEKNNIKNAIRNNDYIITVSNTVKNEIIETFNVEDNKVFVVYNTVPEIFLKDNNSDTSILKKYNLETKKYILSVATLNKRKNLPMLIQAFNEISSEFPNIKLTLIGGMGSEDKDKLAQNNKNIIFTGYIEDKHMPVFYKNALLYAYPSIYEGFGIPLIEALYCKTPVLCSDIKIFREIGENYVEYFKISKDLISGSLKHALQKKSYLTNNAVDNSVILEKYSIEIIKKQIHEVLKNIT